MRTLALVLARGGSKRLPLKNVRDLLGKPMIAWSIEAALKTPSIDRVLVSTDSENIQKIAKQYGADAPFLRPESLSNDLATSADAAIHALNYAESHWGAYDAVILLEPTSPLRKKEDLESGIQILNKNYDQTDGVVSLGKVHLENPLYCKRIVDQQVLSFFSENVDGLAYFPYGVFYLIKSLVLKNEKSFYTKKMMPYLIERWQNYEVDDEFDFTCVESILKLKLNEVR